MRKLILSTVALASYLFMTDSVRSASTNLVLRTRTITWQAGISTQLVTQLNQAAASGKPVPAFVKFTNSLSLTDHQLLRASGVRLENYLRDDSYSALLPSQSFLTDAPVLALVFAAEHWEHSDKLQVTTSTNQLPNWAYNPQRNTVNLLVGFWRSIDRSTITNDLSSVGLVGIRYGADNSWAVVVPVQPLTNFANLLTNLAALLSVKNIEPGPLPFFPLNETGRACTHTDDAQGFSFAGGSAISPSNPKYTKVSGDGVRIAICDNGIDEGQKDFEPTGSAGSGFYHVAPAGTPRGDHATHVASVALGDGNNSASDSPQFRRRGHAPQARVGNYYTNYGAFVAVGGNAEDFYRILHIDGSDVSNHSYVQSWTVYDSLAASLDMIVRGDGKDMMGNPIPARPSVWGAGNNGYEAAPNYDDEEGYYSVFTSAKNTISVGSVDTRYAGNERLSWFSSLGPTFDGRIKPDLVAPGCRDSIAGDGIIAAKSGYLAPPGAPYSAISGTSIAAPVVTGIIALMMHQYKQTFSIFPNSSAPPKLQPATYKAILIHTARDLVKKGPWPSEYAGTPNEKKVDWENPDTGAAVLYDVGPDFATGYGLVNGEAARAQIADSSHWVEGIIQTKGSSQTWCIDVPAGANEVKVVIAWDDEPGENISVQTAHRLVNDLDLVLKDPNGNLHLPWTLAPLPLTTPPGTGAKDPIFPSDVKPAIQSAADHVNNVEMALATSTPTVPLAPGIWKATVTGFDLPMGNMQLYGLISSFPVSQLCPVEKPTLPQNPNSSVVEKDICKIFPQVCNPGFICIPRLQVVHGHARKGYIRFPMSCPVPIGEICKYLINCPGCRYGPAWQLCGGFEMNVQGLPKDTVVLVFNERGQVLDENSKKGKTRTLTVPEQLPGVRLSVLVMPEPAHALQKDLQLKFSFEPR